MINFTRYYNKLGVNTVEEMKAKLLKEPGTVLAVVISGKPKQLPVNMYDRRWCDHCKFNGVVHKRQDICPKCFKKFDKNNIDSIDKEFNAKFKDWQDTKNFIHEFQESGIKDKLLTMTFDEFLKIDPMEELSSLGTLCKMSEFQRLMYENIEEDKRAAHILMVEEFSNLDLPPTEKIKFEIGDEVEVKVDEAIYG